jgi:uncharacterized protein (TIGR02266 family)
VDTERKILIADDAAMFRELGSLFLARSGRVITANNGYEGLMLARRDHPNVVVADLEMPCMGGDELCRRLKTDPDLGQTPVILVTPGGVPEDRARAVRAGADDVIAKPISRIALIQAVNRLLRGQPLRGLARVALEAEVQIVHDQQERRGTARNLSRGGIFVEADHTMPLATEVALEFRLPEAKRSLAPTAQVIWHRPRANGLPHGMGLQFLALDSAAAEAIDSFVYERAALPLDSLPAAAGAPR